MGIVALTKIFKLAHGGQTLVRTLATPTLPTFATACLQLLKQTPSEKRPQLPLSVIETIFEALSTLIPLYPTTLRPFASQIHEAVRPYLAPTATDELAVPESLQIASRKLLVSLHYTVQRKKRDEDAEEWAKQLTTTIKVFHKTADVIFRAVQETWEHPPKYTALTVSFSENPPGLTKDACEGYPRWTGITAGGQRLVGLLRLVADFLCYPTSSQVTIPVGEMIDAVSRVVQIARQSRKPDSWAQSLDLRNEVSKVEKDELWSVIPSIHIAALDLLLALSRRLERNFIPLVPEALDSVVRVFRSGITSAALRCASYKLATELLRLAGPTLAKTTVSSLDLLISGCCRDLQQHAGVLIPKSSAAAPEAAKKNGVAFNVNADLFLGQKSDEVALSHRLDPENLAAAEGLLAALLAYLPQRLLKPALRGLMDQTAIVTGSRDAMLASILNPYRNRGGRMYPSLLPFLSQQFPGDQILEVLRRRVEDRGSSGASFGSGFDEVEDEKEQADEDAAMADDDDSRDCLNDDDVPDDKVASPKSGDQDVNVREDTVTEPVAPNPFQVSVTAEEMATEEAGALPEPIAHKRKLEAEVEKQPSKRVDTGEKFLAKVAEAPQAIAQVESNSESGDDIQPVGAFDSDSDDE